MKAAVLASLLSATGLEFAFSQAPASMKSTIMSFWLLTTAVGNFLVAAVTNLNDKMIKATGAMQFLFYAALTFLVAGVFIWCAMRYQERPHQPGDTAVAAAAADAKPAG